MFIGCTADTDPQALVTVYFTVSIPGVIPVTTPVPVTLAFVFVTLHTPPVTVSVITVNVPAHNELKPDITPALAAELTVTLYVATAVPQLLVTL